MTDLLDIRVLGGLTITRGGVPVTGLASRKAEALLVYLACTGQPQPREVLADLLWDDRSQSRALGNLRVLLASLRRSLEPYVSITRQTAAFNLDSPHRLDVAELERGLAGAREEQARSQTPSPETLERLAEALAHYRGDFLPGFYLRDCRGFEEWLVLERERLRLRTIEGLHDLVAGYLALGDYAAGQTQAERLLQLDPLQEAAHRQLMLLLTLSGRRSAALSQFETCRRLLADELGVEPMPETVALYERIRSGEVSAAAAPALPATAIAPPEPPAPQVRVPTPSTPFIGRREELAQIAACLADPACRLLTLVGPGGIGKTRLAIEAAQQAAAPGENSPFAHGVYFISLVPLSSADFLVSTIADALNFSFYSGEDPTAQLLDYLRQKSMFLVLDNFEHLLEGADLVAAILAHAPGVKILAVSRERLNLHEERLLPIQGLRVPEPPPGPALESGVGW